MQFEEENNIVKQKVSFIFKFVKECFLTTLNLEWDADISSIKFGLIDELLPKSSEELICITFYVNINGKNDFGLCILKKDDIRVLISKIVGMQISEEDFELDDAVKDSIIELFEKIFLYIKVGTENTKNSISIKTESVFPIPHFEKYSNKFRRKDMVWLDLNFAITSLLNSKIFLILPCIIFSIEQTENIKRKNNSIKASNDTNVKKEISGSKEMAKVDNKKEQLHEIIDKNKSDNKIKNFVCEKANLDEKQITASTVKSSENKLLYRRSERKIDMDNLKESSLEKKVGSLDASEVSKEMLNVIQPEHKKEVKKAEFEQFDESDSTNINNMSNLKLIMSIPIEVSVELGRAHKKIKEVLEYGKGTIIQLDKQAGAQVDIIINGQKIAKGDVVVVDENFGVRITEIAKPKDILDIF